MQNSHSRILRLSICIFGLPHLASQKHKNDPFAQQVLPLASLREADEEVTEPKHNMLKSKL